MLDYLIRFFLRITNRSYLIQFFDGLASIGKPTDVLYPKELLDQASLLGLSGLNNTLAIQSNQHWIWPYWVERQLNPDADEFIPTGVNLLTNNLSYRNWTALSIKGNRTEAMLDPMGMITMEPFSWSVMPYLVIGDEYFVPSKMESHQVQQCLHKKNWPEVTTRYKTNKQIELFSKCKAIEMDRQQVVLLKCSIKNLSKQPFSLIFGLTIRPYNPLTIGHIHKLSYRKNLWKINGKAALYLLEKPNFIHTSNRLLGDPIAIDYLKNDKDKVPAKKGKTKHHSRSGISAGIAAYEITLHPGEQVNYQFLLSDKQGTVLEQTSKYKQWKEEIKEAENHFKESWMGWSKTGVNLRIPNKRIQKAFYSVKNHLCVFDDEEQFTPGSFFYHTGWFRDSAFLCLGFDQAGYFQQVKNKFPHYIKLQAFNGCFKSQQGEWDSTGQAIFTIISHIRRSGDIELLKQYYPSLLKGAKWINKTRITNIEVDSPHFGLLPAGLSAEHFGPNDYYYWDNFWSLAGIQQLIWAAKQLNQTNDCQWLQKIFTSYWADVNESIGLIETRASGNALPCSPYRWMDTAAIGNIAAVTPLHIVDENEVWVGPTLDYLWNNNVKNGLFYQHIIHTGFNIYLSIQLAKVLLIRGDQRWKVIFKAVLAAASATWTWPEAIHPKTGGGCMGDGDHGWAAAEFISLIRDMFVFEKQNALYLGAGIFSEWYKCLRDIQKIDKKHSGIKQGHNQIEFKNAATLFGSVSYFIEKQGNSIDFYWEVIRNPLQEKVPLYFVCPYLLDKYSVLDEFQIDSNSTTIQLNSDSGYCSFKPLRS